MTTPKEAIAQAIARIESEARHEACRDILSRFEMIASIVPASVTKKQLLEMIRREIDFVKVWEANR